MNAGFHLNQGRHVTSARPQGGPALIFVFMHAQSHMAVARCCFILSTYAHSPPPLPWLVVSSSSASNARNARLPCRASWDNTGIQAGVLLPLTDYRMWKTEGSDRRSPRNGGYRWQFEFQEQRDPKSRTRSASCGPGRGARRRGAGEGAGTGRVALPDIEMVGLSVCAVQAWPHGGLRYFFAQRKKNGVCLSVFKSPMKLDSPLK